MSSQCKHNV